MGVISTAMTWAIGIANDNSHGYSQANRWGPDYDCSSFAIEAYQQAGLKLKEQGANYTGDMYEAFRSCGFDDVTASVNLGNGDGLQYGDVLHSHNGGKQHAALYAGNGEIVHARSSEGNSIPGDQNGNEIRVQPYYGPWDHVLRYNKEGAVPTPAMPSKRKILKKGMTGEDVRELQQKLKDVGYKVEADGKYGSKTYIAVCMFQDDHGLTIDGEAGPDTIGVLDCLHVSSDETQTIQDACPIDGVSLEKLSAFLRSDEFKAAFKAWEG